jgi:hypothetical protein
MGISWEYGSFIGISSSFVFSPCTMLEPIKAVFKTG